MTIQSQIRNLVSSEHADRIAIKKCLASGDVEKAILLERKISGILPLSWMMVFFFFGFALTITDRWLDAPQAEFASLRFYSLIFASLAVVSAAVHLSTKYFYLFELRKVIRLKQR